MMTRRIGTVSRGLRAPIIKEGDDLRKIVVDTFMDCVDHGEFEIGSKDVLAVTESILARAQRNYATTDQLAQDVKAKLGGQTIGVVFPILSRNRFAICLRGIAKGAKKIIRMISYRAVWAVRRRSPSRMRLRRRSRRIARWARADR